MRRRKSPTEETRRKISMSNMGHNGRTLCWECHKTTDTYGFKCLNNLEKIY